MRILHSCRGVSGCCVVCFAPPICQKSHRLTGSSPRWSLTCSLEREVNSDLARCGISSRAMKRKRGQIRCWQERKWGALMHYLILADLGFPLWLRLSHSINLLFIGLVIRGGIQILGAHPRLYWNNGYTPRTEWLKFTKREAPLPSEVVYTARNDEVNVPAWLEFPVLLVHFHANITNIVLGGPNENFELAVAIAILALLVVLAIYWWTVWYSPRHKHQVQVALDRLESPIRTLLFHRLPSAQHSTAAEISPYFWINGAPPTGEESPAFLQLAKNQFRDWHLQVGGLVQHSLCRDKSRSREDTMFYGRGAEI